MPTGEMVAMSVSQDQSATAGDDDAGPQPVMLFPKRVEKVSAPLPPKRPDFEGVTPASRSLGAVVADAEQVDAALEAQAAAPPHRPTVQMASFAPTADTTFVPATPAGAAAGSILFSGATALPRPAPPSPPNSPGFFAAYDDTNISCFPPQLRAALNNIAAHYNAAVEVTSGFRDHGRAHSMHRYCLAADIRIEGVGPQALAAYAKTVENINGVGTYRYNTVTHIDVRQDKMAWRY